MKKRKYIAALVVATAVASVVSVTARGSGASRPVPIFRLDLRLLGYVVEGGEGSRVNHFDLNFLGEDSLLVSANVRVWPHSPAVPLMAEGRVNLLLFNIVQKSLTRRAEQTLESYSDVIKATRDGRFLALNLSGLMLCSSDLTCGEPLATQGPVKVSPDGRMLIVGGDGRTDRRVLDSSTFTEIARFPWNSGSVEVAGTVMLLDGSDLITNLGGRQEKRFVSFHAYPQFLNAELVASYTERAHEPKKLVTQALDGTARYETIVESSWPETKIIPATNGKRFCIYEVGYNRFSLPNLLGYGDVPYHFERVRVLETDTGKPLFELRWDPRPYWYDLVKAAISPDGHRLAIARHGFLEVFEIP